MAQNERLKLPLGILVAFMHLKFIAVKMEFIGFKKY
jgi:hypothetical protein